MIKKLRFQLVLAAMLSLFLVLSIIIGTASFMNYQQILRNADRTLLILRDNDGRFPDRPFPPNPDSLREERFSRELPFESRYFVVKLDSEGTETAEMGRIASVDEDAALRYAAIVREKGKSQGFLSDYRYISYQKDGSSYIIFLDCGRILQNFQHFIRNSSLVATLGLLAVFLILISISQRVVKPFAESYEKQRRFITDAGHELKTPLTIINADSEILEMDFGENEWLSDIKTQAQRLTDLTNHLILLSRMEEDHPKTEMTDFSLSELVSKEAESFQSLAKLQNKTLSVDLEENLTMHGDQAAIQRLLAILLDNAVKYSGNDGRISMSLQRQKNTLQLTVRNSCEHISKESTARLFDRFYRTDSSRNSKTGGFGLGLSIAAATVKAHKGKITASTQDEKSLELTVTFPLGVPGTGKKK